MTDKLLDLKNYKSKKKGVFKMETGRLFDREIDDGVSATSEEHYNGFWFENDGIELASISYISEGENKEREKRLRDAGILTD